MEIRQLLGIWQVTENHRSIPLGYTALCREIEKLLPEDVGYKIVQQMEEEGYISTLPNGNRVLTTHGLTERIPLPARPVISGKSNEINWTRFRRICAYYSDCITQSEKTQEYLFETDLNTKYFLPPSLPIDWLINESVIPVSFSNTHIPAINRIKSRSEDAEDVYIGYPLSAFLDSLGKMVYSPILLFPVDVTFDKTSLQLRIRRDEIDINRTWIEYNIARDDQKDILTSICFSGGNKTGLLDANSAVRYLANRFKVELDPNYLDY